MNFRWPHSVQAAPAAATCPVLAAQRARRRGAGFIPLFSRLTAKLHSRIGAAQARPASPLAPAATSAAAKPQQRADPAELPPLLSGVRIVLVSPKTPANIGAVLRVAENFEAYDVVVVDPRCDARGNEVAVTSCFSPLLHRLRVVPSLSDALADCSGSIGFTRRAGSGRLVHASMRQMLARFPAAIPALLLPPSGLQQLADAAAAAEAEGQTPGSRTTTSPAQAAAAAAAAAVAAEAPPTPAGPGTVALVFGREESGLLEAELLLCSHACAIPTGRTQPSLNLSHAAAVVLSPLFDLQQRRLMEEYMDADEQQAGLVEQQQAQQAQQHSEQLQLGDLTDAFGGSQPSGSLFESERVRWKRDQALASASMAELELLLRRAAALLEAAGISSKQSTGGGHKGNHGRRKQLMGHIRALLLRGQPSPAEVRALHGLCKELERRQQGAQHQDA